MYNILIRITVAAFSFHERLMSQRIYRCKYWFLRREVDFTYEVSSSLDSTRFSCRQFQTVRYLARPICITIPFIFEKFTHTPISLTIDFLRENKAAKARNHVYLSVISLRKCKCFFLTLTRTKSLRLLSFSFHQFKNTIYIPDEYFSTLNINYTSICIRKPYLNLSHK